MDDRQRTHSRMYLIPIGVPLFRDGTRLLVQTDWRRAIELLRDSLGGRYGELVLVSPVLPADGPEAREQRLEPIADVPGVRAREAYDGRVRAREFWTRVKPQYLALIEEELARAEVVHTGLDDLFRPMMGLAFRAAVRRGLPTVFVQDTDVVLQVPQLAGPGVLARTRAAVYVRMYERACRRAVADADLTLMKSGSLERRYRPFAKNLRVFEDTSYFTHEIAPDAIVEERLSSRAQRSLRLVYCGRLVQRKGVHRSIEILARAAEHGARFRFDVIGGGPEEARLAEAVARLGSKVDVHLLGSAPYGPGLIARLASYDALLFTPTAEDTPRMIFDGYAAGLPLLGTATDYNVERMRRERAGLVLPQDDVDGAARALVALDRDRRPLDDWTKAAREAARYHAADAWYARRAEWTHEAVELRRAAAR